MRRFVLVSLFAAACGGDDGGGSSPDAAMQQADASMTNKVVTVTCPTTTVPEVTPNSGGTAYVPMQTTISLNGIVKFIMPADHNVTPNTITTTDPGMVVPFNSTRCLQFTMAGTYGFACGPHGFAGTVVVNP